MSEFFVGEGFIPSLTTTLAKYGEQFIPLANRSRTLGRDQVPEELPDDGDPLDADSVDGCLGVARQRSADAADVVVRLTSEQAAVAVSLLPQASEGEGEQR